MLQGVWKQHLRPCAVVGYGVKIFLPSPPNYVTRSPGRHKIGTTDFGNVFGMHEQKLETREAVLENRRKGKYV